MLVGTHGIRVDRCRDSPKWRVRVRQAHPPDNAALRDDGQVPATPPLAAIYDAHCELCRAAVGWIRLLDRRNAVHCVGLQDGPLSAVHPDLQEADCMAELHVVDAVGRIDVGWAAVVRLAEALPAAKPLALLDRTRPTRAAAERAYGFVARNRHQLSTCRGGSCSSGAADHALTHRKADAGPFWTCYSLGMLLRLSLVAAVTAKDQTAFVRDYTRTFRRREIILDDRLELWFLGGRPADVVPLAFGERFSAVWYRGVLVDPGSVRMRRSLDAHLRRGHRVTSVTATHGHEEHVGNLEHAAAVTGAPLVLPGAIASGLRPAARIPRTRAAVIGQPPDLVGPVAEAAGGIIETEGGGRLEVIAAPGHSPDHVVLWDAQERVLLVGDTFMGVYFSSPNPDVDSRVWIETLRRLLDLDIGVMVEGHGHVHTLRRDIPERPGIVTRQDPRVAIERKLAFLTWLSERVTEAKAQGMSDNAAVAMAFPWRRRFSWQRLAADEIARVTTLGEFSRHELVRSFQRSAPHAPTARYGR